jgi:hypothetical protein
LAQLNYWYAETNRSSQRCKRPYEPDDFLLHKPPGTERQQAASDAPPRDWGPAGAALLELERRGLLPSFACAADPQLERAGKGQPVPTMLALSSDQALLLAPWADKGQWRGFLLAEPEVSGQELTFSSVDGEQIGLRLPDLEVVEGVLCCLPQATLPLAG